MDWPSNLQILYWEVKPEKVAKGDINCVAIVMKWYSLASIGHSPKVSKNPGFRLMKKTLLAFDSLIRLILIYPYHNEKIVHDLKLQIVHTLDERKVSYV